MRRYVPCTVRASVFTVSVFASPGTPSTRRWPSASIATSTRSRKWSCPTTTFLTSKRMRSGSEPGSPRKLFLLSMRLPFADLERRHADRGRRVFDGNREADADERRDFAGIQNRRDDADHFAVDGDERTAGAARIR